MSSRLPNNGTNTSDLDILGEVNLEFFTANPTAIAPFGASVLSWLVSGPKGFQVLLNASPVGTNGQQAVQPTETMTYSLYAAVGQFRRQLGKVTVTVDAAGCQTNSIGNPRSTIQSAIAENISTSGDLYFKDGAVPNVTFAPGMITIQLHLGYRVKHFPDPTVDITASFGLAVMNGALVETDEQINPDVSEVWYAWLIPGAIIGLTIALDLGKDKARERMHNGLLGVVQLLNFYLTPPGGYRMQSVSIDAGNNGAGIIETVQCPDGMLLQLAGFSSAGTLE